MQYLRVFIHWYRPRTDFLHNKSVSGLAVKFDVAIVEPPVRLRADAIFLQFYFIYYNIALSQEIKDAFKETKGSN